MVGFGDRSTGSGTFGANLGRTIVTNGDFTASVCDSAATRPSSQITFGRLVGGCCETQHNVLVLVRLAVLQEPYSSYIF